MSDLISRQAVLESLKTDYSLIMFDSYGNLTFTGERIIEAIKRVPSVEQEREKGKWIEKAEDYYKAINEYGGGVDENTDYFTDDIACPKCLSKFSVIDNETERFDFCPACGADMREVQNGNI